MFEPKIEYRYFVTVPHHFDMRDDHVWYAGRGGKAVAEPDFDSGASLADATTELAYWQSVNQATPEFVAALKIVVIARLMVESGLEVYDGTQH